MLLTNDPQFADHVRYLSTQARQPVVHYEHTDIGYNYRMSNLLAALGRAQLSRLDGMIARRRMWRDKYRKFFSSIEGIEIFGGPDEDDNCWLTSIVLDPNIIQFTTSDLQNALNQSNIESRPLWKPMHLQPVFKRFPSLVTGTSQSMFENGLTLPSGSQLEESDIERVSQTLTKFLETRL